MRKEGKLFKLIMIRTRNLWIIEVQRAYPLRHGDLCRMNSKSDNRRLNFSPMICVLCKVSSFSSVLVMFTKFKGVATYTNKTYHTSKQTTTQTNSKQTRQHAYMLQATLDVLYCKNVKLNNIQKTLSPPGFEPGTFEAEVQRANPLRHGDLCRKSSKPGNRRMNFTQKICVLRKVSNLVLVVLSLPFSKQM